MMPLRMHTAASSAANGGIDPSEPSQPERMLASRNDNTARYQQFSADRRSQKRIELHKYMCSEPWNESCAQEKHAHRAHRGLQVAAHCRPVIQNVCVDALIPFSSRSDGGAIMQYGLTMLLGTAMVEMRTVSRKDAMSARWGVAGDFSVRFART